jgi:glycerophosphoryl diester phosphodiesterase
MEIIAHRGSSLLAPENTLAAIHLAWQENADAAEADFRLTRDGQIVAIHDATTERTCGVAGAVAQLALTDLQALDAGRWKGESWRGQRIPTLGQCLGTVPAGKRFFVELKSGVEIVPELVRVVRGAAQSPEQVVVISLSWDVVAAAKQALPEIKVYHVTEFRFDKVLDRWLPTAAELIDCAGRAGIDGLDLMAGGPIDAEMTGAFQRAGLELYTWTVDDPELARHLLSLGVTGITTNRPGWLRQQLHS